MKYNGSFGLWLRQRRKALDLTQAELADQVGCSPIMIRKIETGERRPSKQISERMADALAISMEERAQFVAFARNGAHAALNYERLMPATNLPMSATPFIGREGELTLIADRLNDSACRLLTLLGAGGIGKTRLALQAAANQIGRFVDGVYFVSLTPVGSTTFIASAIASALGFSFCGQEDPDTQIINYLRGKQMLLILDNYEHLLGGITFLAAILANAPRLKILVTSRERLNMQEEWLLPVEGLPFSAAAELFVQTARRVQPSFSPDGTGVADICRAVEGLPLGIELAASWLRALPCSQIAAQIRNDVNFLTTPLRNLPERHRSLRAVFEHSWGLLSEIERRVLMKISVFRGGIDSEAAQEVAGVSLALLAGLVDKSLVRLNASDRYEMHELLRQFAADKLSESGQEAETRTCHLQFFQNLAEQLEPRLFGPLQLASFERLENEHDNCRAALDWALQIGNAESGLRLAGALGWYWNLRAHWVEGREWLEKLLNSGQESAVQTKARAILHILLLKDYLGDKGQHNALCQEALCLAREIEDPHLAAWLISSVGYVGYPNDNDCERYLEEALVLFRKLGDQWGICETLSSLAIRLFHRGEFAEAGRLQEEGIGLARRAGDKSVLAWMLTLSACWNWYQGNIDPQIEGIYRESLALFQELRYKLGICVALCQLGKLARLRNEDQRARAFFEQSLSLAQQIGDHNQMSINLLDLAEIFYTLGEIERSTHIIAALNAPMQKFFAGNSTVERVFRLNYQRRADAARAQLGAETFAIASAEGQRMTLDQAVAYALADEAGVMQQRASVLDTRLNHPAGNPQLPD